MKRQSINLLQFQKLFADEASCLRHLFRLRWPNGYVCPRCGGAAHSYVGTRRLYQCKTCRYQVSLTAGTIFHKTRTPIHKWFWMIFMMTRQKSGVSILRMQKLLGIGAYKTAWLMGHKIRKGMKDRDAKRTLAGLLEMDFVFSGSIKGRRRIEKAERKTLFLVGVERNGNSSASCSMRVLDRPGHGAEENTAKNETDPIADIEADGRAHESSETPNSPAGFRSRRIRKAMAEEYPSVRAAMANIKGNIRGVHHGVSRKHLHRYLSEFCYRFNRRHCDAELFNRAVLACIKTKALTWTELTQ